MAQAIHASDGRRWRWQSGVPLDQRWTQLEKEILNRPTPKYNVGESVSTHLGNFRITSRWWFGCWWYHMTDGAGRFANAISLKESHIVKFKWSIGHTVNTPFTAIKCSIAYTHVALTQNGAVPRYGLKLPHGSLTWYSEAELLVNNPDNQWVVAYKTINSDNPYLIFCNSDGSEAIFTSKLEAYRFARAGIRYHDNHAHTWAQYRIRPYEGHEKEHILTTQTPPAPWRIGEKLYTPIGHIKRTIKAVTTIKSGDDWQHRYTFDISTCPDWIMLKSWKHTDLEALNKGNQDG